MMNYFWYYNANGLCFSVNKGIAHPPSLINIFKEIEQDLNIPYPKSGDLMPWADQGVLLLNATLTVRAHQAGSHQNKGWEQFTNAVIQLISEKKNNINKEFCHVCLLENNIPLNDYNLQEDEVSGLVEIDY